MRSAQTRTHHGDCSPETDWLGSLQRSKGMMALPSGLSGSNSFKPLKSLIKPSAYVLDDVLKLVRTTSTNHQPQ
jgi:hypothetical protein